MNTLRVVMGRLQNAPIRDLTIAIAASDQRPQSTPPILTLYFKLPQVWRWKMEEVWPAVVHRAMPDEDTARSQRDRYRLRAK